MPIKSKKISYRTLLVISLFFVSIFTILSVLLINRGQHDRRWVDYRRKMNDELNGALSSIFEMESTRRGYFITHDARVMETYVTAEFTAVGHIDSAIALVQEDAQRQQLLLLKEKVRRYRNVLDDLLKISMRADNDTSGVFDLILTGDKRMDEIRISVYSLLQSENQLLANRVNNVDTYDFGAILIAIIFGTICILIIIYSFINLSAENAERRQAEKERELAVSVLSESEARYRNLYDASNDAIIITNEEGKIVAWNNTAVHTFGYGRDEVQGKTLEMLMPDYFQDVYSDQGFKNFLIDGEENAPGVRRELTGRHKSGREFPVEATFSHWDVDEHYFFSASVRDITLEKQAQNKLNTTLEELKRSNEDLGQFAYIASHDLQEPLRKIRAFGDRLSAKFMHVGNTPVPGAEYVERMTEAAERMQVLINDLLSFSRVSRNEDEKTSVDLNTIVKTVLDDMEITITQSGAALHSDMLPVIKAASATQMRQLFQNIISNAIKFRKPDVKPEINITCDIIKGSALNYNEINAIPSKNYYKIEVRDNGIGFEIKYLEKIFTIFQRLHGKNEYKGTGIGLAVCRKICENHRGFITARSSGEGSVFIILLPAH